MRKKGSNAENKVKELDCIIKSIRRRIRKHPNENLIPKINQFSDQQVNELKRGVKELEKFINLYNEDEGKEDL